MRFSHIALFALPALAAASAVMPRGGGGGGSTSCSTGSQTCCNSTFAASPGLLGFLQLLGINVAGVTGLVGFGCTGIVGSSGCSAQAVCCQNVYSSSLIGVTCSPITIL